MSGKVFPLTPDQASAVVPSRSVWLSASAGTGKTQVLSARVLRLLLRPNVVPGQILCLTFTKAGAAEMAERVNSVLARWVRLEETKLARELIAIGAPADRDTIDRARTLFASVLDGDASVSHTIARGRKGWVQVVTGTAELNGRHLEAGDGVAIHGEEALTISSKQKGEVLLFDMAA